MDYLKFVGPRKHKLYRLTDQRYNPEDDNYVRYVGRTCVSPSKRMSGHRAMLKKGDSKEAEWLREVASSERGLKNVRFEVLEVVDTRREAKDRESYWIAYHEQLGYNLTNVELMGAPLFVRDWQDPIEARIKLAAKAVPMKRGDDFFTSTSTELFRLRQEGRKIWDRI